MRDESRLLNTKSTESFSHHQCDFEFPEWETLFNFNKTMYDLIFPTC